MSPSRANVRRLLWLPVAAVFAAAPKCVLCLAAYAGVGALFGLKLTGPEICGGTASGPNAVVLALAAVALAAGGFWAYRATRHLRRRVRRWLRPDLAPPSTAR